MKHQPDPDRYLRKNREDVPGHSRAEGENPDKKSFPFQAGHTIFHPAKDQG